MLTHELLYWVFCKRNYYSYCTYVIKQKGMWAQQVGTHHFCALKAVSSDYMVTTLHAPTANMCDIQLSFSQFFCTCNNTERLYCTFWSVLCNNNINYWYSVASVIDEWMDSLLWSVRGMVLTIKPRNSETYRDAILFTLSSTWTGLYIVMFIMYNLSIKWSHRWKWVHKGLTHVSKEYAHCKIFINTGLHSHKCYTLAIWRKYKINGAIQMKNFLWNTFRF
jgi:hypothetical protein